MKEREVILNTAQSELTTQSVNLTLNTGDIFMPEDQEGPKPPGEVVKDPGNILNPTERELLSSLLHNPNMPVGIKSAAESLLGRRIIPMGGSSDTDPSDVNPVAGNAPEHDVPPPVDIVPPGQERLFAAPVSLEHIAPGVSRQILELFRGSELYKISEDVPDNYEYDYEKEDPDRPGEVTIKHKVIPTNGITGRGILGEANARTIVNIEEGKQRISRARDTLTRHISIIQSSDDYDTVRNAVDGFIGDIDTVAGLMSESERKALVFTTTRGRLDRLEGEQPGTMTEAEKRKRIKELKAIVKDYAPWLIGHYTNVETRGEDMPRSLEDLVKLARDREEGDFARGGVKDLIEVIKVRDADGNVVQNEDGTDMEEERASLKNFYEWVRHQMWRVHDFNSTSEANFFSDEGMGVKTTFRTINYYEMIFTPSFFRQKRSEWVHTVNKENGEVVRELREGVHSNDDYNKLREALLYEVYIFQLMRNGDWVYRDNMSGVKGMTQALQGICKTNPLTKDDYMERILSMPSMHRRALGEKGEEGKTIQEKMEANFIMGDAVRTAWDVYLNIWDFKAVSKLLGSDSTFFKREYDEYDDKGKTGNRLSGGGKFIGGEYNLSWFDAEGNLRQDLDNKEKKKFMTYMNLFMGPSRNQTQLTEIRRRIALSLVEKYGISLNEARVAEAWAYSLCRFTGIGARNDTESVGFDQWTKQGNLEKYRQRQKSERRRAKRGSKYTMEDETRGPGLKRITLTLVEAVRDVHDRAVYEIMQGGQGANIDLENNPIKKDIDFERNYQKDPQGNYLFANYDGRILSQEELQKYGLGGTNIFTIVEDKITKKLSVKFQIVTTDANGQRQMVDVEPHKHGLRPVKADIIFRNAQGQEVDYLRGRAVRYELDKDANSTFYDENGIAVDVGELKPRVVERDVQRIEFDSDVMRQFMANVIEMSSEWYEFVIESKEMGFLDMIKGTNSAGRPIIDQAKLGEVRDHIRKNITYSLSTWAGTDYTKRIRTWEELQEGERGYIKDPELADKNHEMSFLRSMFGDEALAFVQLELRSETRIKDVLINLNKDGLSKAEIEERMSIWDSIDVWRLEDFHDVLGGHGDLKREVKIAIWTGIFTYMVAKEIENHRALDTNEKRWNQDEVRQVMEVLHDGELLNEDEFPIVQENTSTQPGRMFAQAFLTAMTTGNLEGFWEMIKAMAKQPLL